MFIIFIFISATPTHFYQIHAETLDPATTCKVFLSPFIRFFFDGVKAKLFCGNVTVPGEPGECLSRPRLIRDSGLSMPLKII